MDWRKGGGGRAGKGERVRIRSASKQVNHPRRHAGDGSDKRRYLTLPRVGLI